VSYKEVKEMEKGWRDFREFAEKELEMYAKNLPHLRGSQCSLSLTVLRLRCKRGHKSKTYVPFGGITLTDIGCAVVAEFRACDQISDLEGLIRFLRGSWGDLQRAVMGSRPRCGCGAEVDIIGAAALFIFEGKPTIIGTSDRGENVALRFENGRAVPFELPTREQVFDLKPEYVA
jgi:hypothetical protein